MSAPLAVLLVAVAGGLGALVRFALARLGHPDRLPWPILVANVAASFVAGMASAVLGDDATWTLVLVTGLCGGLSTFSTFAVETVQLADRRRRRAAIANVALTLGLGIGAAALGLALGTAIA